MWVLEAAFALWFWASFAQSAALPLLPEYAVLKSSWAAEQAWHADESVWETNALAQTQWREKTGCCVTFSRSAFEGCSGENRVAFAKTLWRERGLETVFVAAACTS